MSKRPLVPSFLQKLDNKLLRNKPGAWSSRTHLVLYFAVVFALLLSFFCYFVFFDAKQYSSVGSWVTFVALIAFVGFVFWLIFLLRFNVFKRYGNWSGTDGLRDFCLYFISIGAMVAVCFIPAAIESWRANQQFGNEEIVKDINELNINASRLEYGLLPLQWKVDTCRVVETGNTIASPGNDVTVDTVISVVTEPAPPIDFNYQHIIDTAELRRRLITTDSVLKMNDSLYVFFECPDYRFVSSYSADDYSAVKLMSPAAIYNACIKNYQKPDRSNLLKRMEELKKKYAISHPYYESEDYYPDNENTSYDVKIRKKYSLNKIKNGIDNIVRKKYAWKEDWPIFLRIFYYTTLLLTLLVFIFRHTTVKTFFLSLLTGVLLVIISGLILVFNYNEDETILLSFMILYYVIFAILALSIFKINTRKAIQGISLNLFLLMTPFVPLIFVALTWARRYRYAYNINEERVSAETMAVYTLIAEIAGSVILLILIQPLFKKLYRKWYSAPEE